MRRFITMLSLAALTAVGCQHVGGKCDCGPQPGDAAMYAPFTHPHVAPAGAPGGPEVVPAPKKMPDKL